MIEIDAGYIRGWFDSSSYVNVGSRSILFRRSTEQPTRAIYAALRRMGIECTFSVYGDQYELRIGRKKALEKYRKLIGFHDKYKAARLDEILEATA